MISEEDIVNFDGQVITLSTGQKLILNNNNEFEYDNDIYLVFKNYTTTRTHYNLCDFETNLYAIPCIVTRTVAMQLINYIINLSVCLITFVDEEKNSLITMSFIEAFKSLQTNLEQLIINQTKEKTKETETIIKTLEVISGHLDLNDIEKGTFNSNLDSIVTVLDTKTSISEILSKLIEYINRYVSFDDATINHRTLNSSMDRIYTIICILSYYSTTPITVNLFTNKNNLIGHKICEVLYDALTDRTTKELFNKGRNPEAKKILHRYEKQYPFLVSSDLQQILVKSSQSQTFSTNIEKEEIILHPFILLCHVSDMERLGYLYDYFTSNKSQISSYIGSLKWPTKTEYFKILNNFIVAYKQPIIYNIEQLVELLPQFIHMDS